MSGKAKKLPTILFSLKPEFTEMMLAGTKRHEFRKSFFREPCMAYVYETAPISAVTALIEFGEPIVGSVRRIAGIAESESVGGAAAIRGYLKGKSEGMAIPVISIKRIKPVSPAQLREVWPNFRPTQSYIILDNKPEVLRWLEARGSK